MTAETAGLFVFGVMFAHVLRGIASARWGQLRHIDCLRQLVRASGEFDPWDMACENCGRHMRGSDLYAAVLGHVAPDGSHTVTRVAVWHSKRPACAAAAAADPRVREVYAAEDKG